MITALTGFAVAPAAGGSGGMGGFGMIAIVFAIFYFMIIRPQQRKEKARIELINNVKVGDRIMFGGGLLGVVSAVKEENVLLVKVADGVKIEVVRGAVSSVIKKDEKVAAE